MNVESDSRRASERPHPNPSPPGRERGPSALGAYIELARLSNAPTIISNVLVGVAIGVASLAGAPAMPWLIALGMSLAILLLYIAGMALNDAMDVAVDRRERPQRPIPSGRIRLQAAYAFAALCMTGGIALAASFGFASGLLAGALVIAIVLYNVLHRRFIGAAVFMGLCRGLVYLTAAAAVVGDWSLDLPLTWAIALPLAIALSVYITLLTLLARGEADAGRGLSPIALRLAILMIAAALAPALWIAPADWTATIIAAFALIAWLVAAQRFLIARPPRMKDAVMAMLAGICLVDAYFLALLGQAPLAVLAAACFVLTVMGHRRIAGT